MKKILKWLGILLLVVVVAASLFAFSMRFHDGPLAVMAGGPFRSGELTPTPADWSFLKDREVIEFQTMDPARSRVVWLGVYDGRLFLVSGYMNTGYGALWKQWPHYLEDDDRILLRIDGRLYEQRLQRIMSGPEVAGVLNEYSRKYFNNAPASPSTVTQGDTWMFEVLPR